MHKVKGLTSEKQKRFMVAVPSAWLRPELKPGEWRAVGRSVGRRHSGSAPRASLGSRLSSQINATVKSLL